MASLEYTLKKLFGIFIGGVIVTAVVLILLFETALGIKLAPQTVTSISIIVGLLVTAGAAILPYIKRR